MTMKTIENEEEYYSLPNFTENQFTQHTPVNMVYKAMIYTGECFWANDIQNILKDRFGLKISTGSTGSALRKLWNHKLISRELIQKIYVYTKTDLYHQSIRR